MHNAHCTVYTLNNINKKYNLFVSLRELMTKATEFLKTSHLLMFSMLIVHFFILSFLFIILPKNKKFVCVGRGDLTLFFPLKSYEIDKSPGDLFSNVKIVYIIIEHL